MPGSRRVSRQRLRKVLAEGLQIRWGKKFVGLEEVDGGVKVGFEDGSEEVVDYVLGTDGPGSRVRESLFKGKEEEARVKGSGFMIGTVICKYGDAGKVERCVEINPVATVLMGVEAVMGIGGRFSGSGGGEERDAD
jgi:2-polyprenyl-6-methoxyphenol hydroxylase-like FAD-dependent oxidoreductase